MSLTKDDLTQIRQIVREEVDYIVGQKLEPLEGEIKALRNDIKEIYSMIAKLEKNVVFRDEALQNLSVKEQILQLNAALVALAKKEGLTLPR